MRKLLVYDTDDSSRSHISGLLEKAGFAVVATGDQHEAALHCEAGVDLALVDLPWGSLDALEVALRAKLNPDAFVPVVIVAEDASTITAMEGFIRGVDGFLNKPIVDQTLLAIVNGLLQTRANYRRAAQSGEELLRVNHRLPGLYNRKFLTNRLRDEIERARLVASPMSVWVIDVDDFKNINYAHGYARADKLLTQLTSFLRSRVRSIDTVCRFGGEEFVAVRPGMGGVRSVIEAERLRKALAEHDFEIQIGEFESVTIRITASFGIAAYEGSADDSRALLRLADEAVWMAKLKGKNRTVLGGSFGKNRSPSPVRTD